MDEEIKDKLVNLGAEKLADTLIELSHRSDEADEIIKRITASNAENVKRFKNKISGLKRIKKFISYGESFRLSKELCNLIEDIKSVVNNPLDGLNLITSFYETDKGVIGHCDDSSGSVGDVYRIDAKEAFLQYAKQCKDKNKVLKILIKLNKEDDYGVRDSPIYAAGEYLSETQIKALIKSFQEMAEENKENRYHYLNLIESLARQAKDIPLYIKTKKDKFQQLTASDLIDISEAYFENGNLNDALGWLKKIPENDTYETYRRNELLIKIYRQLNDKEKLEELIYNKFHSYHSLDSLKELLDIAGEDKKDKIIEDEVQTILSQKKLILNDVIFLIEVDRTKEAEGYLLKRAEQLNGDYYDSLLRVVKLTEKNNLNLASTLIYRNLLNSILEKGYTKAYAYGIKYLNKLDALSSSISNWQNFEDHTTYKQKLYAKHKRKVSFWSKYGGTL